MKLNYQKFLKNSSPNLDHVPITGSIETNNNRRLQLRNYKI